MILKQGIFLKSSDFLESCNSSETNRILIIVVRSHQILMRGELDLWDPKKLRILFSYIQAIYYTITNMIFIFMTRGYCNWSVFGSILQSLLPAANEVAGR